MINKIDYFKNQVYNLKNKENINFNEIKNILSLYFEIDSLTDKYFNLKIQIREFLIEIIIESIIEFNSNFIDEIKSELEFFLPSDIFLLKTIKDYSNDIQNFNDLMLYNDLTVDQFINWYKQNVDFDNLSFEEIKKYIPKLFYFSDDNYFYVTDFKFQNYKIKLNNQIIKKINNLFI